MTELETRKLLVLTTAHVTADTAEMLNNTPCEDWPAVGGPYGTYGWFFYVHDDNCSEPEPIPDDLWAVMQFAHAKGFHNILFDCDAEEIDDLPTYEW